jgi:hypothetical protein
VTNQKLLELAEVLKGHIDCLEATRELLERQPAGRVPEMDSFGDVRTEKAWMLLISAQSGIPVINGLGEVLRRHLHAMREDVQAAMKLLG